jgi:tRNA threonylcarbamoyladenosine biosynthesis protein TsaB
MRVLALDTTTRAGSVAVVEDDRVVLERVGEAARTHAERLPGDILDALAAAGCATSDVDLFAVAAGPGSFTGLRIGIATIQGLAFVHRRPIVPVSALRALAEHAAAGQPAGVRVGAWMDAHRRDVFSALYAVEHGAIDGVSSLVELEGPHVSPPADTVARWAAAGMPAVVCGDGAMLYPDALPVTVVVRPAPALAGLIGRLASAAALAGKSVGPAGVQPLYVRRPDAEIARDAARSSR